MRNKIIFIAITIVLLMILDGCAGIGYSRTAYNGQNFNGVRGSLPFTIMKDDKSRLIGTFDYTFYNAEQPTVPNKADYLTTTMLGLDYHQSLIDDMFGVYGELGYGTSNYSPTLGAKATGSGISYGGGIDTLYNLLRIGYRSTPIANTSLGEIFIELRIEDSSAWIP